MRKLPARFFIRFFHNHGLLNLRDRPVWRVIKTVRDPMSQKLIAGHRRTHTSEHARCNRSLASAAKVIVRIPRRTAESFDCVFIASHSDQALRYSSDATEPEHEVLERHPLPVERSRPAHGRNPHAVPETCLGSLELPGCRARTASLCRCTYHLNRLQGLGSRQQYFVTLNGEQRIRRGFRHIEDLLRASGLQRRQRCGTEPAKRDQWHQPQLLLRRVLAQRLS